MSSLQAYNPGQQHLVVTSNNVLNVEQGSVADSFGLGFFATVTQGMGLREVDKVQLEKNVNEVTQLNAKLAEALSTLTPQNLDEVVSLTKNVNHIGKAAHVGCSVCCVDLVRSEALQAYNDDLELMNGTSSRYLAIFKALKSAGASSDETCQIINLIVKRDDAIASTAFVEKDVFVRELLQIASHNQPLKDLVESFIVADEQKALEYDQHKAANRDRKIPKELMTQFSKVSKSLQELMLLALIMESSRQLRYSKVYQNYTDEQVLQIIEEDDQKILANSFGSSSYKPKPVKELKEIQKSIQDNPEATLAKYDRVMKEAISFSGIVLKRLLHVDSQRRIQCLVDQKYYLFRLFFMFPQVYRCCVLICGEEKAFQNGTIQFQWRQAYHQFRDSMCTILNDPELRRLYSADERFANYLTEHQQVGAMYFDSTPT